MYAIFRCGLCLYLSFKTNRLNNAMHHTLIAIALIFVVTLASGQSCPAGCACGYHYEGSLCVCNSNCATTTLAQTTVAPTNAATTTTTIPTTPTSTPATTKIYGYCPLCECGQNATQYANGGCPICLPCPSNVTTTSQPVTTTSPDCLFGSLRVCIACNCGSTGNSAGSSCPICDNCDAGPQFEKPNCAACQCGFTCEFNGCPVCLICGATTTPPPGGIVRSSASALSCMFAFYVIVVLLL